MITQKASRGFEDLDRMFAPASIAIVGVSSEGFGFGRGIFISHIAIGYEGKLYPVNKRGGSIEGMTIYPSVEAIPDNIDFAIIAVPAQRVSSALEACRKKGAVGAEILSSGFREIGTSEGIALEEELQIVARRESGCLDPIASGYTARNLGSPCCLDRTFRGNPGA